MLVFDVPVVVRQSLRCDDCHCIGFVVISSIIYADSGSTVNLLFISRNFGTMLLCEHDDRVILMSSDAVVLCEYNAKSLVILNAGLLCTSNHSIE